MDHSPELLTTEHMMAAGVSYRQLDYWTNRGYLRCDQREHERSGHARYWPAPEREIARLIHRLTGAGMHLEPAVSVAREMVDTGMPEATIADGITLLVERR